MLMKGGIAPITELLKAVKELFTDTKGKWSSKRTISGVIVLASSLYIDKNGIDTSITKDVNEEINKVKDDINDLTGSVRRNL